MPRAAAAAVCPLAQGRLSAFSLTHGPALDTYVWVLDCKAISRPAGVSIALTAGVWLALKSDVAGVLVDQFVHATVSIQAAYALEGGYVEGHAELTLRPLERAQIEVVPVGTIDVEPLNWATLAANVLAPKLGTTGEWVAKEVARKQALDVISGALEVPLRVAIDARHDRIAPSPLVPLESAPAERSVIAAPRGTALVGPFAGAKLFSMRDDASRKSIAVKSVCTKDIEAILARDRRGAVADLNEWRAIGSDGLALDPGACPWLLAVRTTGGESRPITLSVRPGPPSPTRDLETVWVALDAITVTPSEEQRGLQIWVSGGEDRVRVFPPPSGHPSTPVFTVGSGGSLVVDAIEGGTTERLARARIPLSEAGPRSVILRNDDAIVATVAFRLAVVSAPAGNGVRP